MRNIIGPKKVAKLAKKTGLPVLTAMTRGDTDHRIDLCLSDGTITRLYKDGSMKNEGHFWNITGWKNLHPNDEKLQS